MVHLRVFWKFWPDNNHCDYLQQKYLDKEPFSNYFDDLLGIVLCKLGLSSLNFAQTIPYDEWTWGNFFSLLPAFPWNLLNFTSGAAFLDALKICPTTSEAEVMFSAVNLLASDVRIWARLEIFSDSVGISSTCFKKNQHTYTPILLYIIAKSEHFANNCR